jgi:hypothetical protein
MVVDVDCGADCGVDYDVYLLLMFRTNMDKLPRHLA